MLRSTSTPTPTLLANNLSFSYPQGPVFANVSLHAPCGVSLVRGGDGCGKTTLLRVLAGDLPAGSGTLQLGGICFKEQPLAYKAQVFWMDFKTAAFDQITAQAFWQELANKYPNFDPQRLSTLIGGLSLSEHQHKALFMLSTGSKRKVWLAGAFASGAALTLIDDPFAALDKPSIGFVLAQIKAAAQEAARAWVVAHFDALGDVPVATTLDLGD